MLNYQYFYRFHHVSTHQDDKISSILLYLSFQITLKYVPGCLTNKYLSCTSSWPYGPTSFEHEQPDPPPLRPWPIFTTPTTKSCGRNSIDEHRTVIVKLPVIQRLRSVMVIMKFLKGDTESQWWWDRMGRQRDRRTQADHGQLVKWHCNIGAVASTASRKVRSTLSTFSTMTLSFLLTFYLVSGGKYASIRGALNCLNVEALLPENREYITWQLLSLSTTLALGWTVDTPSWRSSSPLPRW